MLHEWSEKERERESVGAHGKEESTGGAFTHVAGPTIPVCRMAACAPFHASPDNECF
jgi:hypothetical protein